MVCVGIINRRFGRRVECTAARLDHRSHPITLARFPRPGDEDIASLRKSKRNDLHFDRFDGNEIHCNDTHRVSVNADVKGPLSPRIDKSETMDFAGFKEELGESGIADAGIGCILGGAIEIVLAVDEIVVGRTRSNGRCFVRAHEIHGELGVVGMVVIVANNGTEVDVVGVGRRTVDNHGPKEPGGVLGTKVRMVPGCPVEIGAEAVGVRFAGSNGTLMNSGDAVHVRLQMSFHMKRGYGVRLEEAVPVNCSAFIEIVLDVDFPPVSPIGLNRGTRVLLVDNDHRASYRVRWRRKMVITVAIRGKSHLGDGPIVVTSDPRIWHLGVGIGGFGGPSSPWIPIGHGIVGHVLRVGGSHCGAKHRAPIGHVLRKGCDHRRSGLQTCCQENHLRIR